MDRKRDCTVELVNYIQSLGITVNIGKNKAKGNKGIFSCNSNSLKIDISKNISDNEKLSILLHEFAHYIHYKYDNTLKTLNFVFPSLSQIEKEELVSVTVNLISKRDAQSYFNLKNQLLLQNKEYLAKLRDTCKRVKASEYYSKIEQSFFIPYKYLIKYDSVNFSGQIYTIKDIDNSNLTTEQILYLKYKSNQRFLKRINNRINRLNKYYNQNTELWARFLESYFLKHSIVEETAPLLSFRMKKIIISNKIPELVMLSQILLQ